MSHDDNDDPKHPKNLQAHSNVVTLPTGDERVEPDESEDDATLRRLAGLSFLDYDRERTGAAAELGVRAVALDREVKPWREKLALEKHLKRMAAQEAWGTPRFRATPGSCAYHESA